MLNIFAFKKCCCSSKKEGAKGGKTKRGKGTKLMVIADASGLALAAHTDSASPHEFALVQATLNEIITVGQPKRIIGDRACEVIRSITPLLPKGLR